MGVFLRMRPMQSFFSLIDYLNALPPEERPAIEKLIWNTYGVERAVLTLDMSQFSLSVRRSGILNYLGRIRRMQVLTRPIVVAHRGEVIKYAADNMLAVFGETHDAVAAAVGINRALRDAPVPAGTEAISVSIGIDYGRFILVPGQDCYGDAVNVSYKLGEDLARPGEILVSAAARARLGEAPAHVLAEQRVSASGLELVVHAVEYSG
jgi:class 3 adenylate cyclase